VHRCTRTGFPLMVSRIGGSPMPRCRVRSEAKRGLSSSHHATGELFCSTETTGALGESTRTSCFGETVTSGQLASESSNDNKAKNKGEIVEPVPSRSYCQRQLVIQVVSLALIV
jgi:hypothetical protein